MIRIIFRTVFCMFLTFFLALECLITVNMFSSEDGDLDYIIVLGAKVNDNGPSGALFERIIKAYRYLSDHPDTKVIASGGQGSDEYISEAESIKQILVYYGIDESRIILEDRSTNTAENIRFSAQLIPEGSTVGLVSNNFHILHAKLLADKYIKGEVYGIAAPFPSFLFLHFTVREAFTITFDILAGNI
ncbi:MAG: YdcF family protein [Clostridia bacterium]|nr:YdcF family protein [Clostridia bacterium]